jgi:hypothetical protein
VGQRKRRSAEHSNTHFSKCVNLELTIRQSFAKLRQIWGSNFAGEGKDQASMNMEERGAFYRRGGGSPKGVCVAPRRNSPPLHGGNPLINMR